MPIYTYKCFKCILESEENVAIANRDEPQLCECGNVKYRKITYSGTVWSPTANGGMK